ncbi:MAG TPA: DUF3108 domain-containing protein [Kofleriaceae bacterium]|jgi:hypothetical protein|nr:DUF3108 domain-containing protein [Kofleriaceae bacterium]
MRAAALAAICAASCGGTIGDGGRHPDAHVRASSAERPVLGLQPGESMTFEVKVGGILAGEAALAVGQPGVIDGHRAIEVRSRIATAGAFALLKKVSDEATTIIATDTATPIAMSSDVTMNGIDYHADVAFKGPAIEVTSTRSDGKGVQHDRFTFGAIVAHDTHSAMASMRGWDPTPGTHRTLWVMGGKRIWKSEVTFGGRETIGTQLGNRAAIRIDGFAWRAHNDLTVDDSKPPREFSVWLSDDADRVPLRVVAKTELGDLVIELTDYQRP